MVHLSLEHAARALGGVISDGQILAPGPDHSAGDRSLSIKIDPAAPDGFLVESFAGDDWKTCRDYVRQKLSMEPFQPKKRGMHIVATYDYRDENGALVSQVCRLHPKDFRQRRPDGRGGWDWKVRGKIRVIVYRLQQVLAAIAAGRPVFIVEGEKDADALAQLGIAATCNAGGASDPDKASKWKVQHSQCLAGADVIILPDNDGPGRAHANAVAASLQGIAARVRVLDLPGLPEKGDVSDWLAAGGDDETLAALIDSQAQDWQPPADGRKAMSVPEKDGALDAQILGAATQDDIALAFVRKADGRLRYCHTQGAWFFWTDRYWRRDESMLAFHYARNVCRQQAQPLGDDEQKGIRNAGFASGVERFGRADPAIAATYATWDADPWLLGTPGGTVDLRTGEMRAPDPTDGITKITAVPPAAQADCPAWLSFLHDATKGDPAFIRFLQQICGYCLTGVVREHVILFMYGPGGNGKGTFLKAVTDILAAYAVTAAMTTFTAAPYEQHPTDLAMLRGARLVSAQETEAGRKWAKARIQQMTGGDPITARFMRHDFFTYIPQFKIVIAGNHEPELASVDDAIRRRFHAIPFRHKPETPDLALGDRLRTEYPGILRWMIDGCLDWRDNSLTVPSVVADETERYLSEQDAKNGLFTDWLEACCIHEPGNTRLSEPVAYLYDSWRTYTSLHGVDAGSKIAFGKALESAKCAPKRTDTQRLWQCIALKRPAPETPS